MIIDTHFFHWSFEVDDNQGILVTKKLFGKSEPKYFKYVTITINGGSANHTTQPPPPSPLQLHSIVKLAGSQTKTDIPPPQKKTTKTKTKEKHEEEKQTNHHHSNFFYYPVYFAIPIALIHSLVLGSNTHLKFSFCWQIKPNNININSTENDGQHSRRWLKITLTLEMPPSVTNIIIIVWTENEVKHLQKKCKFHHYIYI